MRLHQQECSPHAPREDQEARKAFTLTELLVVIAIIAILSALGTWGVFAMIATRQKSNSEVSMRVINKMMQDRWAAVVADAKKETPSTAVMNLANNDVERARVIWVKVRLSEAFPMSYNEVSPNDSNTIVNKYIPTNRRKAHFNKYQAILFPPPQPVAPTPAISIPAPMPGESSACLLLALNTIGADSVAVSDQLKPAIAPTGSSAVNMLIDGWANPIEFKRFFFNDVIAPNPAPSGSRNASFGDATDNDGKLMTPLWYNQTIPTNPRATFESAFHSISPSTGRAYYVIPAIVSWGRDKTPGTPDDIYSFQLRGD